MCVGYCNSAADLQGREARRQATLTLMFCSEDDDEDGSDRDFSTSDEDTDENIVTEGKLVLHPTSDSDSA